MPCPLIFAFVCVHMQHICVLSEHAKEKYKVWAEQDRQAQTTVNEFPVLFELRIKFIFLHFTENTECVVWQVQEMTEERVEKEYGIGLYMMHFCWSFKDVILLALCVHITRYELYYLILFNLIMEALGIFEGIFYVVIFWLHVPVIPNSLRL